MQRSGVAAGRTPSWSWRISVGIGLILATALIGAGPALAAPAGTPGEEVAEYAKDFGVSSAVAEHNLAVQAKGVG